MGHGLCFEQVAADLLVSLRILFRDYLYRFEPEVNQMFLTSEKDDGLPGTGSCCKLYGEDFNMECSMVGFKADPKLSIRDPSSFGVRDFAVILAMLRERVWEFIFASFALGCSKAPAWGISLVSLRMNVDVFSWRSAKRSFVCWHIWWQRAWTLDSRKVCKPLYVWPSFLPFGSLYFWRHILERTKASTTYCLKPAEFMGVKPWFCFGMKPLSSTSGAEEQIETSRCCQKKRADCMPFLLVCLSSHEEQSLR